MSMKFANRAQNRVTSKDRVPVSGMRDIMTVFGKDPAYNYRWVVDVDEGGNEIWNFTRGGYEFAPCETDSGELVIGQQAVYKSEQKGENIVRIPSGQGKFSYLMRIKKEWYDTDQAAKWKEVDDQEAGIFNRYGEAEDTKSTGQYMGEESELAIKHIVKPGK